jgi:hypothetical protein
VLIRAELAGGLDVKQLCALADFSQSTQVDAASGAKP